MNNGNYGNCTDYTCSLRNSNGYCKITGCVKTSLSSNAPEVVRIVKQCELTSETIDEIANAVVEKLKELRWSFESHD